MFTGFVTPQRQAVVRFLVHGADDEQEMVEAIIDTGSNGFLTVPRSRISTLNLAFAGTTRTTLVDGNEVRMDVFEATVLWDDQTRHVAVLASQGDVLVGMAMLTGHRVTLEVEDGGSVTIEALVNE